MRGPLRLVGVGALAVVLVSAACSKNTGTSDEDKDTGQSTTAVLVDDAKGPATPVPGAKKGGTITVPGKADFEHLDPAQTYVVTAAVVGSNLLWRSLTTYRENGDGKLEVVGDLATSTGEKSDGGKTWTYHLREGLKYEDGSPITAADVAYGVARSFSPDLSSGPHFIQTWLAGADYNATYQGPYNGASKIPPGVTVPDDKTIVFHFQQPEPDLPFAATMGTTSPVPAARDTKVQYDNRPISSGPYKIQSYLRNQKLVLVKNAQWDPQTDPTRHQYPDRFVLDFTRTADQATNALIVDRGADQSALTFEDMAVSPALYPKAAASAKDRILHGPTTFVWQLDVNTQRVADLKVRQALNYAIDRQGFLKAWGSYAGQPATTILSPTTSGYTRYDAYPAGANGNIAKAKKLLGNKPLKLVYAYQNTERDRLIAAFLFSNLKRAGITITPQPVDPDQYYPTIGKRNNPYDLYISSWGSDWPGASTVLPPQFNGAGITPTGNQNLTYLNQSDVDAKLAGILKETDVTKAASDWAALDREIMTKYAPVVPLIYDQQTTMYGSKVGGIYLSIPYGNAGLNNIYVK